MALADAVDASSTRINMDGETPLSVADTSASERNPFLSDTINGLNPGKRGKSAVNRNDGSVHKRCRIGTQEQNSA